MSEAGILKGCSLLNLKSDRNIQHLAALEDAQEGRRWAFELWLEMSDGCDCIEVIVEAHLLTTFAVYWLAWRVNSLDWAFAPAMCFPESHTLAVHARLKVFVTNTYCRVSSGRITPVFVLSKLAWS